MLNGGAVAWRSKREPIVVLSTAESEYVAACYSTQEIASLSQAPSQAPRWHIHARGQQASFESGR
eukprot:1202369-Rhodomonas_salina.1